jgi:hypothetical protein
MTIINEPINFNATKQQLARLIANRLQQMEVLQNLLPTINNWIYLIEKLRDNWIQNWREDDNNQKYKYPRWSWKLEKLCQAINNNKENWSLDINVIGYSNFWFICYLLAKSIHNNKNIELNYYDTGIKIQKILKFTKVFPILYESNNYQCITEFEFYIPNELFKNDIEDEFERDIINNDYDCEFDYTKYECESKPEKPKKQSEGYKRLLGV